jgi:carboxylesterase type B
VYSRKKRKSVVGIPGPILIFVYYLEPQSEDCLTLNVYTPSQATANDKFTVMVWIHGGGFVGGSGSGYNPSVLVAYHDVIVVTINYRLGVLGFFNIPGTDVKGNYGMHDQVL